MGVQRASQTVPDLVIAAGTGASWGITGRAAPSSCAFVERVGEFDRQLRHRHVRRSSDREHGVLNLDSTPYGLLTRGGTRMGPDARSAVPDDGSSGSVVG
ncbi:hypothetical protein C1701_21280 [Actinoalloteichus sp. AHMU CJ021]|nr:hypothetical protein C1701_21280 [Actinoalloteichus sp. AHMU CJ021]